MNGEAIDELERLLSIAVKRQCLSDVPLGAFLSGGIDSSTIVALMQAQASQPVRTFSIGFAEGAFNEAEDAAQGRRASRHCRTPNSMSMPKTAMDVIPQLPRMYDEPFADSSQIPTHLVAALARQHVTVALSGDGGDELFGGYNRHVWGGKPRGAALAGTPAPLRRAIGALFAAISPRSPPIALRASCSRCCPRASTSAMPATRWPSSGASWGSPSTMRFIGCFARSMTIRRRPIFARRGAAQAGLASEMASSFRSSLDPLDRMTLADSLSYLTDDILQKVDRAAMAVALETRVPFLDKDVVEFAATVPPGMKVRDGRGKWLVGRCLYRHVPQSLIDRPKTGFSIPLDAWLRGPLKSWTLDLLSPARLQAQRLFNVKLAEQTVREHMCGARNHSHWLWNVLMFQAWHDAWCAGR